MVHFATVTIALALAASVSGYVVPRSTPPAGWVTEIMEPYDQYHARYVALHCQDQHSNATFFDACCHPMKADETLATARPAYCDPANLPTSTSVSTSAAPAATQITTGAISSGDEEEEGDCKDDDEPTEAAPAPVTSEAPAPSTAKPQSTPPPATSDALAPTTSVKPKPAPEPATTLEPTTTPKPTTTHTSSKPAATSPASSSSGSLSGLITGGFATFYDQGGAAGSCGKVNPDSALIVAVQIDRMNPSLCGKKVEITNTANGKTVTATVADTCPGCKNNNSLDLSRAAFDAIGDEATGVLNIAWKFL